MTLQLVSPSVINAYSDHIVFLGDLVSKGPHSLKVVKLAMELGASAVMGNHDYDLLGFLGHVPPLEEDEKTYRKGPNGEPLVGTKEEIAQSFEPGAAQWMLQNPFILKVGKVDGEELVAVHGGLLPGTSLENQGILGSEPALT
jgi:hypothetical protein